MIEPSRALSRDLIGQAEIGPRRQHQSGPRFVRSTEASDLDNAADRRDLRKGFQPAEADMVGPPVDAVDHGIGFAGQLIMQPPVNEAADDWRRVTEAIDRVIRDRALLTAKGERPMHGLDDVTARAEFTQFPLGPELDHPLIRARSGRESQALEILQTPAHQPGDLPIRKAGRVLTKIDGAGLVGRHLDLAIEPRPAIDRDLLLQCAADLVLRLWPEFERNQLLGARAQAAADVVARDDEIRARLIDAADQHMNVRIVRIPVVDSDPLQPRREIGLHLPHQVAGERLEIHHVGRILRRHDEPEMMPVPPPLLLERSLISLIAAPIEHAGRLSVPRDAVALEIGEVSGQRCRAERPPLVPDNARLDRDPPCRAEQPLAGKAEPAPSEQRMSAHGMSPAERRVRSHMACGIRGTKHPVDEALRLRCPAMTNAPRPNPKLPLAGAHGAGLSGRMTSPVPKRSLNS